MSDAPSAGRKLFRFQLAIVALATAFSHDALAQTERQNAQVNAALSPAVTAAATTATPNPDCTLIVPRNPLTATGLATPYQLTATDPGQGACNEANTAQSAFVQAAVF